MRSGVRTFDVTREIAAVARGGGLPRRDWSCGPVEDEGETCRFELFGAGGIDDAANVIALPPTDRPICSSTTTRDPRPLSVCLAIVTLGSSDTGTRLLCTQQSGFLGGGDRLDTRYARKIALPDRMVRAWGELRA